MTKAVIRVPAKVPAAVPVTVIGGYLRAGKITLINHLLRTANGVRLAVLVNEFGALSIDEDLIEAEDGNIISIAGGCICCSFGDDLSAALMDICAFKPPPDHILIEASGVAIPAVIDNSLTVLAGGSQTVSWCWSMQRLWRRLLKTSILVTLCSANWPRQIF
ncbi:MAG: GTP-binding protein [Paracoccaceae bacterium]